MQRTKLQSVCPIKTWERRCMVGGGCSVLPTVFRVATTLPVPAQQCTPCYLPSPVCFVCLIFAPFPAFLPRNLFPHHFALCVHSILQIIPHHPILLYLFPTLLFSVMKNLVTLSKGLLNPSECCLKPPLSLFSLSILPLRLGSCFQKRLWSSLSLQPRLQ